MKKKITKQDDAQTLPVEDLNDLRKETLKIVKIKTGAKTGQRCWISFSPTRCGTNTMTDVGTC